MKLDIILEGIPYERSSLRWKTEDPENIARAIEDIKQSPEFLRVADLTEFCSTKTELSHGTLSFVCWFYKSIAREVWKYTINVDGQIRGLRIDPSTLKASTFSYNWNNPGSGSPVKNKQYIIRQEHPREDSITNNYRNALIKLYAVLNKRISKIRDGRPWVFRDAKSVSEFDLPNHMNNLDISGNRFSDLIGCPQEISGDFICENNIEKPLSLKGGPRKVLFSYYLTDTKLENLEGIADEIDTLILTRTGLKNLDGIESAKRIKNLILPETMQTGIMRNVFRVPGLLNIEYAFMKEKSIRTACDIINKHLKRDHDMIACKKDLIAAGVKEFTK